MVRNDITMAALSGTSSHNDIAHLYDCGYCRRRACSVLGRYGPLVDRGPAGALAFVRRPLGGGMVPQLAAPSPFLQRVVCRLRLALVSGSLPASLSQSAWI